VEADIAIDDKRIGARTTFEDEARTIKTLSTVEVRVPASTSNLGAGFDCCGLALKLYLRARASVRPDGTPVAIRTSGEGASLCAEKNLLYRAMRFVTEREGLRLPPVRLAVRSEIPLASGLGSSGAAILAGVALANELSGRPLSVETMLRYATQLEGHADNVAAALLGGWVVHAINPDGSVLAVRRPWPKDLKIIVVTPHVQLETAQARAALPELVQRADAVFNMQRIALFHAAIENGDYDLLWEAMRDRLHQPYRQDLVPGLAEALAIQRVEGLLGVALSGAGPSVVALARHHDRRIAELIAQPFHRHGTKTTVRFLEVDERGLEIRTGC
jgi:homoserine kinase